MAISHTNENEKGQKTTVWDFLMYLLENRRTVMAVCLFGIVLASYSVPSNHWR